MFVHISDLQEGLFGLGPGSASMLMQSILQNDQPIILNASMVSDATNTSGMSFSSAAVSAFFSSLDVLQKPVWLRIALAPSPLRTSIAEAVGRGKAQMQQIITMATAYGVSHLIAGFALNNIMYGTRYLDGSYWQRANFNELVETAHTTHGKPVAILSDPAIDNLTYFTPPPPRAGLPGAPIEVLSQTHNPTALGANLALRDWIIHINPLYPWHLFDPAYPEMIIDAGRMSATLSLMQTFTNVDHGVVQTFVHDPYMNSHPTVFDGAMGPLLDDASIVQMKRMSVFLESLGIHKYCFTLDAAYGAVSKTFIDPFIYKDKRTLVNSQRMRPAGIANISLGSKNGHFEIYNSGVKEFVFDENLRPLNLTTGEIL